MHRTILLNIAIWWAAVLVVAPLVSAAAPPWLADRSNRLLVRVDPVSIGSRASDQAVASLDIDFRKWLPDRCDLSSLVILQYDPRTGKVVDHHQNAYAKVPGELPLRFYDAEIPWAYPDYQGYVDFKTGKAPPVKILEGGGRYFNPIGDARAGRLAWTDMQYGRDPSYYAIYFNPLPSGAMVRQAPAGFIGDGSNRCVRDSRTFAPVIHGRVAIGDLNGDGLFDLILGNATGTILWYENQGSPGRPKFTAPRLLMTDDGRPLDVGWSAAPDVADWDNDGLPDLIVGAEKESILFFRNVGTRNHPVFHNEGPLIADGKPLRVPHAPCAEDPTNKIFPVDYYPVPQVVDWNGDGKPDLLAGGYITGLIFYYENVSASSSGPPKLAYRGPLQADGKNLDTVWCASPCAADFRHSGKLDLISGSMQMTAGGGDSGSPDKFLYYYRNEGTRKNPNLTLQYPFPTKGAFRYIALGTPRAVDFNNDGLLDLVVSTGGVVALFPNVGTSTEPRFDATVQPLLAPFGNEELGYSDLVDYNRDGWPDLFTGTNVLLNDGTGDPGFFSRSVRLEGSEKIEHPAPSGDPWQQRVLVDLDGDGLSDIVIGDHVGNIWFHRNIGTKNHPRIDPKGVQLELTDGSKMSVGKPPPDAAPFDLLQGARTVVTVFDINHDGLMDVVTGETYGRVTVFMRQPGTPMKFAPGVVLRTPIKNRLTVRNVDWDGDGWRDLMIAYAGGEIFVLPNRPGPNGTRRFGKPIPVKIPQCWGDPFISIADWDHDGDDDLLVNQYGFTRFIERSFLAHGYIPAKILSHEVHSIAPSPISTTPAEAMDPGEHAEGGQP